MFGLQARSPMPGFQAETRKPLNDFKKLPTLSDSYLKQRSSSHVLLINNYVTSFISASIATENYLLTSC